MSRLYSLGGEAIEEAQKSCSSLKAVLYGDSKYGRLVPKLLPLLSAATPHLSAISAAVRTACGGSRLNNITSAVLMVYDLFWGRSRRIQGGGRLKKMLLANATKLRKMLQPQLLLCKPTTTSSSSNKHSSCSSLPYYVRVCPHRTSLSFALETLRQTLISQLVSPPSSIIVDSDVPNLICVPRCFASSLCTHSLVTNGTLAIQDRSSCLSALSAEIRPGSVVLDCCAAPGSKTLHSIGEQQTT
eukprot:GHVS01076579.1.p1 GENE.GHVS01076579.1~~GHVS01076579.1.p1  ORF type:complete len:243 (-),score=54.89 GHVS01076579.1:354-1082(-)